MLDVKFIVRKISDLELSKRRLLIQQDYDGASKAIAEIKSLKQALFQLLEKDYQIIITARNEVLFTKRDNVDKEV